MSMKRRFDASVVGGVVLAGALAFSSCTCQRDVPEPPERKSRLDGDRAWSGLPTPIRDRAGDRREQIARDLPTRRLERTALPTRAAAPPEAAEIPDDFPSDVPVFENAEVFGVQSLAAGAKNVLFRTDGDVPEVFGFYKDSMSREGWDVKQEYEQSNQSFLSFEKDGMITNMTVARDPQTGKQVIAIMYYKQEPLPFEEF
jgi:hypothetical protein